MSYHIWYLTTSEERIPFHVCAEIVETVGDEFSLQLADGTDGAWNRLELTHQQDDHPIGDLEWVPVRDGEDRGTVSIDWFLQGLENTNPSCNVPWIRDFLPLVRMIYVWSLYSGTDTKNGWAPVRELGGLFLEEEDTVVYAELEGWSNTDGCHITWEFTDDATGHWWMGLYLDEKWHEFQIDLANQKHRECFLEGKLPPYGERNL